MKLIAMALLIAYFSCLPNAGAAEDPSDAILASRGKGIVTQDEFSARANKIPAEVRFGVLRDRNRLRDVINSLLLNSQMAADAREAGFDKEPINVARMQLAAKQELADAWLQHFVAMQPAADYDALALEQYRLHSNEMRSAETIDVSHILISTEERNDEEAQAQAETIYQQIAEDKALFDELVAEYSDDPSAASNKGSFRAVKRGDMVKPFEEAAFTLQPGEISKPVKTRYGYHVIRLDAYHAPEQQSFEDAKPMLVDRVRKEHKKRIQSDYLSGLSGLDVDMTEEALREMVRRQFGEEVLNAEANDENSE